MANVHIEDVGEDYEVDGITFSDADMTNARVALTQTAYLVDPNIQYDTQRYDMVVRCILEAIFPGAEVPAP